MLRVREIRIIADCINGAAKAAWFATRNLHLHNPKIILLHTYQKPMPTATLRNKHCHSFIQNTAERELSELKNQIVKITGVKPKSISKIVMEGELSSVLKQQFGNRTGAAVVLGIEQDVSSLCIGCKNQIVSVLKSGIRPVYLVGNGITLIKKDRATFFSGEQNLQDGDYYNFLKKVFNELGIQHSIMHTSINSLVNTGIPDSDPDSFSWKFKDEYPLAGEIVQ